MSDIELSQPAPAQAIPAEVRQALARVRKRIEADYAEMAAEIENSRATAYECGRHYQCDRAARYLMDAGLW